MTRLPPGERVTLRDIAARLGVHPSTVSCALRNHRSISTSMRRKVNAIAQELGYLRDPLLEAFNEHRSLKQPVPTGTTVAFITDPFAVDRTYKGHFGERIFRGASEAAKEYGLNLEPFVLGKNDLTVKRLESILWARNVTAVIVACLRIAPSELTLRWSRYHATCIEAPQLKLRLDTISSDQWQVTRLAVRKLYELGYRRLGLAIDDEAHRWVGKRIIGGQLLEYSLLPPMDVIPPFYFAEKVGINGTNRLASWVKEHDVDAILGNCSYPPLLLDRIRAQRGGRLAFASLDLIEGYPDCAGVLQGHDLVGRMAVENLVSMIRLKHKGEVEPQTVTFVPGRWIDGPTAPPV
ncbi:MAG: LacI family DNA-binding transcriptional regulator [Opitutaceae bacterium]|nr:LacI family DNA-binding transcriptional regulator [Opitutaceae bacterium]